MTITELRSKYNDRIITRVVTDIVNTGLNKLTTEARMILDKEDPNALEKDWANCLLDISGSNWDDVRAVIKRSL